MIKGHTASKRFKILNYLYGEFKDRPYHDIHTFIANYQEAFGQRAELPIAFWYSDRMEASTEKVTGCLFKCMKQVRDGRTVSLSNETIACGGGKFYTGFTEMPELPKWW